MLKPTKKKIIKATLLSKKESFSGDTYNRLILTIKGKKFYVDFVFSKDNSIGSSGYVDNLEEADDFEEEAERSVGL